MDPKTSDYLIPQIKRKKEWKKFAESRDRTSDLKNFSLTLFQLSYFGLQSLFSSLSVFFVFFTTHHHIFIFSDGSLFFVLLSFPWSNWEKNLNLNFFEENFFSFIFFLLKKCEIGRFYWHSESINILIQRFSWISSKLSFGIDFSIYQKIKMHRRIFEQSAG